MRPRFLAALLLLPLAWTGASAQDGTPLAEAPKPRTKPLPKPKAPAPKPAVRETEPQEAPASNPSQGAFAAPPVVCDPGKSVLYDAPKDLPVWVTRTGQVSVENPLRPLTPDVTRVLQLVIAGKVATAYGPDLTILRRGGSPAALEGLLGGPIRWDASLATLPDSLDIVADSGATLASLRFKECGDAPAGQVLPPPKPVAKGRGEDKAGAKTRLNPPSNAAQRSAEEPKPRFTLPQGAIP